MTDTTPTTTRKPRRLLIGAVVAALVAAVFAVTPAPPETSTPAVASSLTKVTNTSYATGKYIWVRRDNGTATSLAPGQSIWGVNAVSLSGRNLCLQINGGSPRCSSYWPSPYFHWTSLGVGQYRVNAYGTQR